jgi:concanavalin A-like lectin/glucanase superfamily protein
VNHPVSKGTESTCESNQPAGVAILASGLVSRWTADGNALVGANNGTAGSDVTYATGRSAQGFSFPGSDATIDKNTVVVPDSSDLKPSNLTVAAWVKFSSLSSTTSGGCPNGEQFIVCKQNSCSFADGWALSYALGKSADNWFFFAADFGPSDEKVAFSTTTVVAGRWYHVVATYDHANFKLYVNGRLEGTTAETRDFDYAVTPLVFGRTNSSSFDGLFNGVMDEVEVFNRALTPAEIPALDGSNPGTGLVSWWPGEGNVNDIQGTNNGTFQNGATFTTGTVGQAFSFDGTSQYVRVPTSTSLNQTGSFTIDAWIYPTADARAGLYRRDKQFDGPVRSKRCEFQPVRPIHCANQFHQQRRANRLGCGRS